MTEHLKLHLQSVLFPEGIHHLQLVGRNGYDTQQLAPLVVVWGMPRLKWHMSFVCPELLALNTSYPQDGGFWQSQLEASFCQVKITASLLYVGHNCIGQIKVFILTYTKKERLKKQVTRTIATSICPSYGDIRHLRLLPKIFLTILIFNIIYWLPSSTVYTHYLLLIPEI